MTRQEPVGGVSETPRRLGHEGRIGIRRRAHQLHSTALQIQNKERVIGDQSSSRPDFRRKEVGPSDRAQCARRKVRHDDGRPGAGGIPLFLSTLATVLRATRWSRFFNAPWIRL